MRRGTIAPSAGEFLRLAVEGRLNIVVAGGTASGKSNFVNALGNAVGDGERILIVEDTPELQIQKADIVQICTRDKTIEAATRQYRADLDSHAALTKLTALREPLTVTLILATATLILMTAVINNCHGDAHSGCGDGHSVRNEGCRRWNEGCRVWNEDRRY